MELFTLGHGSGYTERDVREQARALTAGTAHYRNGVGGGGFRFDRSRHDDAMKVVFGKVGAFNWNQAVQLARRAPAQRRSSRASSGSYFIPVPADPDTQAGPRGALRPIRRRSDPVVAAILKHPLLYTGPRMTKPPVVYLAGMLRTLGDRIATEDYVWLSALGRTAALLPAERLRLERRPLARHVHVPGPLAPGAPRAPEARPPSRPRQARRRAGRSREARRAGARVLGQPCRLGRDARALLAYARKVMGAAVADDERLKAFPPMTLNALRHLVAVSPEMQTA